MPRALPDEAVQEMLDEIERSGREHARLRARLESLRELRKITKARLMKLLEEEGISAFAAQERDAYAHPAYQAIVDRMVEAIEQEHNAAVDYAIAEKRWESWRTISADLRAASRN